MLACTLPSRACSCGVPSRSHVASPRLHPSPQSCSDLLPELGSTLTWSGKDGSIERKKATTTLNGIAIGIVATVCVALITYAAIRYRRRRGATKGLYAFGSEVDLDDAVDD